MDTNATAGSAQARRSPARRFSLRGLKTACRSLRTSLTGQELATADEVASVWPGGAENPDRGMDGWIECYAQLTSFARRLELRSSARDSSVTSTLLEGTVRAAAARQAVPVVLSIGGRLVYPKSMWALAFLDSIDAIVAPMASLAHQLAEDINADEELRGMPRITEGLAWRTWAWILLSEGVGLPFEDEGVIEPPAWTGTLIPEDFIVIWMAHRQLHADATAIMASAMPREEGERSRLSLSGFLAGYASQHGIAPSHIMRRWSLGEAIAAATAAAESHRVSEINAKRKQREGAS